MRGAALILIGALAACSPQQVIEDATRQTAGSVVQPILARHMQAAQADGVTRCILDAASLEELRGLAQDVGAYDSPRARSSVAALGQRPAALACINAAGLPQLPLVL